MHTLFSRCFMTAALILCTLFVLPVNAQNAGALDTTFGGSGRIDIKLAAGNVDQAITLVNYPGRRYLALGRCNVSGGYIPCLARFNDDGSPDASFATAGKLVTQLVAGHMMQSSAVAVQPDGKIVVAGTCTPTGGLQVPCHLRLNANGQIDSAYGSAGSVVATVANNVSSTGDGIAVQSDGKIVVGGTCFDATTRGFCAWRYLATGAIDSAYGTAGNARVNIVANNFSVVAMVLQPDNSAVLAAYCDFGASQANTCLVRVTASGVRDTAFVGGSGVPMLPHHAASNAYEAVSAIALQADGRIVMVGNCVLISTSHTCAARVTTAGTLDASFGGGWVVVNHATLGADSAGTGVAVQRDGKIAVASACIGRIRVCTLRLNSDGSLDGGYGTGGVMGVATSGFATEVAGALLDADERLLVAGGCYGNDGGGITDTCVYRVLRGQSYAARNCTLDVDDDGTPLGANDVLILARVALGFTGTSVTEGVTLTALARRTNWTGIRDYLVTQCGMAQLR